MTELKNFRSCMDDTKDAEKPVDGRNENKEQTGGESWNLMKSYKQLRTGKNLNAGTTCGAIIMYQEQPFQNGKAARVTLTLSRSSVFLNSFL